MAYLGYVAQFYDEVARQPDAGLCCVGGSTLTLPGFETPPSMERSSYGCGTTVHPGDLRGQPTVLYVGVGGGKEALEFAYFSRKPGGVIAVEPVAAMREAAERNLREAAEQNSWYEAAFVELREGNAFALPADDASVDVVAQNCLFNIFELDDFACALREARRVLREGGRLSMSDPVAATPIPDHLQDDQRLRAMCLSGALTYDDCVGMIVGMGFGQIEIRRRRPYRVLDPETYDLPRPLLLESVDLVAFAVPMPKDGPLHLHGPNRNVRRLGGPLG